MSKVERGSTEDVLRKLSFASCGGIVAVSTLNLTESMSRVVRGPGLYREG